jgi:hypothetical protein
MRMRYTQLIYFSYPLYATVVKGVSAHNPAVSQIANYDNGGFRGEIAVQNAQAPNSEMPFLILTKCVIHFTG